ncbi:ankyrin repeat domain-containing protein [Actinomadura barringtoniae]|uniref:Ankyrin repeat domain-containing protein n=1 Tax=Actinomadura barringtoniae TaxID=1427535 RepID=A0A939PNB4_9ACTN|nr:ankyrin repeat domain-containing protein [Actinomadura barringtoniae]MBO2455405.1 ankyrin repeat domain-containing protein [Actinomadura barringtoniae]
MITRRGALAALAGIAVAACGPGDERKAPKMTDNDQALLRAAAEGDVAQVRQALNEGAAIESRDDQGRTPLLLAASADHVEVARELVKAGADSNAQDNQRDSAFLVTGVTGSVAMLRALLPAKPDLTLTNRYGGVALIPACERGHVDYVREVLKTGINVDHVNRLGWTGLLEAIILGDGGEPYQQIVRLLLAGGADPGLADGEGVTPLQHAVDKGQREIADILRGG